MFGRKLLLCYFLFIPTILGLLLYVNEVGKVIQLIKHGILFGFETTANNLKFVCLLKLKFHNIPRQRKHSLEITPQTHSQTFLVFGLLFEEWCSEVEWEWIWQETHPKATKKTDFQPH